MKYTVDIPETFQGTPIENDRVADSHGLVDSLEIGSPEWAKELSDSVALCIEAKNESVPWTKKTLDILEASLPDEVREYYAAHKDELSEDPFTIPAMMAELGFKSWRELVFFVEDDPCVHFFMKSIEHAKKNYIRKIDKGFIDGDGFGDYDRYTQRNIRKSKEFEGSLEKTFDTKKYFNLSRPIEQLDALLPDLGQHICNYQHPPHPKRGSGHATKFANSYEYINDTFTLSLRERHKELIKAWIGAAARNGGLVHTWEDNRASFGLVGTKEFSQYKK